MAPCGTPQPIVTQLNAFKVWVVAMPDVRAALALGGADPADPLFLAMEQAIQDSMTMLANAVRIAGIKVG